MIHSNDGKPLKDFEWIFLDGPCEWQPVPGATQMNFAERRLAPRRGEDWGSVSGYPLVICYSDIEAMARS